jgi:hypothetical protein
MSAAAKKRVLAQVAQLEFTVPVIEWGQLVDRAMAHYDRLPDRQWGASSDDSRFVNRIVLNYLRHQLTDYDDLSALLDTQELKTSERDHCQGVLRRRVLAAILAAYEDEAPWLDLYLDDEPPGFGS